MKSSRGQVSLSQNYLGKTPVDSEAMEFFVIDLAEAGRDGMPMWIVVLSNGICLSGSFLGLVKKYMSLDHILEKNQIDFDKYEAVPRESVPMPPL